MKFLIFFLLSVSFFSTLEGTFICDGCAVTVDFINKLLNDSQVNITNNIVNICDKVTSRKEPFDSLCKRIVSYETDKIIKMVQKYGNSTVICQQLHFCRGNSSTSSYSFTISDKVVIFIKIYLLTNILKTITVYTIQ
uniref:Saposin B-type domain-containing protein n=1 Tax=Strongyloides venezuelensis TaxID=75913 RepID=A0A0K0G5N8_STRVS